MSEEISFEQAVSRLEEIASRLESEEMTLDESVALYGEGMELARLCTVKLAGAKQKITELTPEISEDDDVSDD